MDANRSWRAGDENRHYHAGHWLSAHRVPGTVVNSLCASLCTVATPPWEGSVVAPIVQMQSAD